MGCRRGHGTRIRQANRHRREPCAWRRAAPPPAGPCETCPAPGCRAVVGAPRGGRAARGACSAGGRAARGACSTRRAARGVQRGRRSGATSAQPLWTMILNGSRGRGTTPARMTLSPGHQPSGPHLRGHGRRGRAVLASAERAGSGDMRPGQCPGAAHRDPALKDRDPAVKDRDPAVKDRDPALRTPAVGTWGGRGGVGAHGHFVRLCSTRYPSHIPVTQRTANTEPRKNIAGTTIPKAITTACKTVPAT